jgi:hypothetical protein
LRQLVVASQMAIFRRKRIKGSDSGSMCILDIAAPEPCEHESVQFLIRDLSLLLSADVAWSSIIRLDPYGSHRADAYRLLHFEGSLPSVKTTHGKKVRQTTKRYRAAGRTQ